MTAAEREQMAKLEEKIDKLPEVLLARMDDRYVKKDDSEKRFVTRVEITVLKWIVGVAISVLAIWLQFISNSK